MAQAYLGNTVLNQTWLGNTQINKVEFQPWEFILYGGGDVVTSQADFEDKIDTLATSNSGITVGTFEIQNNNVFVNFDTSAWNGNPFEFIPNAFTGSSATALYSTAKFDLGDKMFFNVTSLQSIYLVDALSTGTPFSREFGEQSFQGCTGLTSANITIDPFSILLASAFEGCTGLTSFPKIQQCGPAAFKGCTSLNSLNWPRFGEEPSNGLYEPTALGFSTGNGNVFLDVASGGTINIPILYSTVNGGSPDGDLVYLSGTKSWTINYI